MFVYGVQERCEKEDSLFASQEKAQAELQIRGAREVAAD